MTATIDDLSVTYVEDNLTKVKELDKVVLSKGAWTTILYKYQDWNNKDQAYGPEKYTIRRYQKQRGQYFQKSKFNISSKDQAQKIINTLENWIKE